MGRSKRREGSNAEQQKDHSRIKYNSRNTEKDPGIDSKPKSTGRCSEAQIEVSTKGASVPVSLAIAGFAPGRLAMCVPDEEDE